MAWIAVDRQHQSLIAGEQCGSGLDPQKLYSFGLQPKDVITGRARAEPGGCGGAGRHAAGAEGPAIPIHDRRPVALNDPAQFAEIIIKDQTAQGGRLVRVKDVARIDLGAQTYSQDFKLNGRPAAGIAIFQTPEANSLAVAKEVTAKMDELSAHFPQACDSAFRSTRRSSCRIRSPRSTRPCIRPAFWC